MNVREEDKQKNSCPSRGLGLAAAAVGVGVGAALYYFFSKRPENPDGEGSTTGWSCEQLHAYNPMHEHEETDSYTTVSENSTTDTSMYTPEESDTDIQETSYDETSSDDGMGIFSWWNHRSSSTSYTTDSDDSLTDTSTDTSYNVNANSTSINGEDTLETGYLFLTAINATNVGSDSDTLDWDLRNSSMGVPDGATSLRSPLMSRFTNISAYISPIPRHSVRTNRMHEYEETDSYTAVSENSTTDTSMYPSEESDTDINETSYDETSSDDGTGIFSRSSSTSYTTDIDDSLTDTSADTSNNVNANSTSINGEDTLETGYWFLPAINATDVGSDSDTLDWDVTNSSMGVPDGAMSPRSPLMSLFTNISPIPRHSVRTRERTWSFEECSICFDVILKDHQVTTLPCTHHFHTNCITPWLQEQQTCPNCRKAVE